MADRDATKALLPQSENNISEKINNANSPKVISAPVEENINDSKPSMFKQYTSTPSKITFDDESSNDSTTLQIVIPSSTKKKKRKDLDIEKEIEEDIERELKKKAKESDLTVRRVKSILRYVLGNDNVLAMVSDSMRDAGAEAETDALVAPKITRSKAKKLREEKKINWPLSPICDTPESDEHLVLIREELPEEEDDDEYKPTLDDLIDHSDDESGRQSVGTPSLDISAASRYLENFDARLLDDGAQDSPNPETEVPNSEEGDVFKKPSDSAPQKKEIENIGQRTRSKLSLSSTPLETIELAFVPPDITTDMYDFKCDNREWENFLKEFMQPLSNDTADGDEDDDPEYTAMGEEEVLDKEELRRDRGVTVSRSELKDLVVELLRGAEDLSSDDEPTTLNENNAESTCHGRSMLESSTLKSPEKSPPPSSPSPEVLSPPPLESPPPEPPIIGMTRNQQLLLMQQIRQHTQLLTQHFMQTHKIPKIEHYAVKCKTMLSEMIELARLNPHSVIHVFNLVKAFRTVEKWELIMETKEGPEIIKHWQTEEDKREAARRKKVLYRVPFHPKFVDTIMESPVFMYPSLLPVLPFRTERKGKIQFIVSEDQLIALSLEQVVPIVKKYPRWCDHSQGSDKSYADMIHEVLIPVKTTLQLASRIQRMRHCEGNPIWYYFENGVAPRTVHYVIPFEYPNVLVPKDQPDALLPEYWREYRQQKKT